MQNNWSRYVRMIILLLGIFALLGYLAGYPLYGLLAGLISYLCWTLIQARRLYQWLANPNRYSEAPQSVGLWGDLFDGLHKLNQTHLRNRDLLRARINRIQ